MIGVLLFIGHQFYYKTLQNTKTSKYNLLENYTSTLS